MHLLHSRADSWGYLAGSTTPMTTAVFWLRHPPLLSALLHLGHQNETLVFGGLLLVSIAAWSLVAWTLAAAARNPASPRGVRA